MEHTDFISYLEDITDSKVDQKTDTLNAKLSGKSIKTLQNSDVITDQHGQKHELRFTISSGRCIAKIIYMYFPADNVGYIGWTRVPSKYQGNNIATRLRDIAIKELKNLGANKIYSKSISSAITHIATEKQGFKKKKSEENYDWLVKNV